MSRHPEPFEAHGITTKTLERAPLAREAFFTSNWPGAKTLVHCSQDNKVSERKEGRRITNALPTACRQQ